MELKISIKHDHYVKTLNISILQHFIIAVSLMFCITLLPKKAEAQSFDPLISFSVESCSLDIALEKLLAEYDINVAFSKADLSRIRIEKYSCSYKSSEEVLADLLKGTDYGFRKIGMQYVIRKNKASDPETKGVQDEPISEITKHKTETIMDKTGDTIRVFDTVQLIRTVMRYDTIICYDSVVRVDTIFDIKYKGYEIKWPKFRDNGWFISPSLAYEFANIDGSTQQELTDQNISVNLLPSSDLNVAFDAGYKKNRISAGMSVSYNTLRYRFHFNETTFTGDYYLNDTLDSYYVVHPNLGDTTYYYILDSTYIPKETTLNSFRDVNRHDYLGLGAFACIDILRNAHFRLFVKAQGTFAFLIHAEGSTAKQGEVADNLLSVADLEHAKFSFQVGLGGAWKVANRVELAPEFYYRKTTGRLFRNDSPINMQAHFLGLRLGLTYYF